MAHVEQTKSSCNGPSGTSGGPASGRGPTRRPRSSAGNPHMHMKNTSQGLAPYEAQGEMRWDGSSGRMATKAYQLDLLNDFVTAAH